MVLRKQRREERKRKRERERERERRVQKQYAHTYTTRCRQLEGQTHTHTHTHTHHQTRLKVRVRLSSWVFREHRRSQLFESKTKTCRASGFHKLLQLQQRLNWSTLYLEGSVARILEAAMAPLTRWTLTTCLTFIPSILKPSVELDDRDSLHCMQRGLVMAFTECSSSVGSLGSTSIIFLYMSQEYGEREKERERESQVKYYEEIRRSLTDLLTTLLANVFMFTRTVGIIIFE